MRLIGFGNTLVPLFKTSPVMLSVQKNTAIIRALPISVRALAGITLALT